MVAYFTPSDTININQFLSQISGRLDGFDKKECSELYYLLFHTSKDIEIQQLVSKLNSEIHPELIDGIQNFISCYTTIDENQLISLDSFILFHQDLFSSNKLNYKTILSDIWIK